MHASVPVLKVNLVLRTNKYYLDEGVTNECWRYCAQSDRTDDFSCVVAGGSVHRPNSHNYGTFNSIGVRVFLYVFRNDTQDVLFGGLYETRGDVTY